MCYDDKFSVQYFFDIMGEESASFFNVDKGNEKRVMSFFENGKPDHRFYVAKDGDETAGICFLWDVDRSMPMFGIAVREDYKGKGVGTFMLGSTFELLKAGGYGGMLLTTEKSNIKARGLYEKCGFECLGVHNNGELLYIKRFGGYGNG